MSKEVNHILLFLFEYGWAILAAIVIIALVTLVYFGVLNVIVKSEDNSYQELIYPMMECNKWIIPYENYDTNEQEVLVFNSLREVRDFCSNRYSEILLGECLATTDISYNVSSLLNTRYIEGHAPTQKLMILCEFNDFSWGQCIENEKHK